MKDTTYPIYKIPDDNVNRIIAETARRTGASEDEVRKHLEIKIALDQETYNETARMEKDGKRKGWLR